MSDRSFEAELCDLDEGQLKQLRGVVLAGIAALARAEREGIPMAAGIVMDDGSFDLIVRAEGGAA
jgi:hypothetical protein